MPSEEEGEDAGYSAIFKNEVIVKLFVITFASFTAKSIYNGAVFSAYIFLLLNHENSAVGFIAGMSGLIGMIMAPIVGMISDKWDRTRFLRTSASLVHCSDSGRLRCKRLLSYLVF